MLNAFNFVDYVIILIVFFYALEGLSLGFIASLFDLISFILSFTIGLSFYNLFGKLLISTLSIPAGFANAIGFFIAAFLAEIILRIVFKSIAASLSFDIKDKTVKFMDRITGALFSALSGILLCTFLLTMAITLPLNAFVKHSISQSRLAKGLTSQTQGLSKTVNSVFGQAVNDTITFLTVEPKGNESVNLNFRTDNVSVDPEAEREMFALVNKERTSRGLSALEKGSQALVGVARYHCEDMFRRGYFSHYTPEGLSPFDRMQNSNISFTAAGENLALAPNTELAMQGLMQSPGHKANILSTEFGHLGVGVIDGGSYGEMFCQEFTN